MKPISGKEFAKIVERRGWDLLRIQGSITYSEKQAVKSDSRFPFTRIKV
jgi:predicted RNA binding protein YcfA (HicA-like mRNA interferase family)